ncbi:hypothetical protein [Desulfosarcina ovata]|uniref:Uncharacterized protein n=1 Tax=Desulfosarcina ovata subsp. ovata TaxID=2752305 RepID=A0A5K8AL02_9BACT|nr:hypothetical protein [Desulfosarcina ovata]BBO93166.1 hypothetical protein DSCOOX_63460 [Desulfosarcina ovata subsp. ovata]
MKQTKIKNPLTVISIFAGLAEVSGTAILPLLDASAQSYYIWFLMIFPLVIVILFFMTLNFNHKVLYAPSDFSDEANFINLFDRATPLQKEKSLNDDVKQILNEEQSVDQSKSIQPANIDTIKIRSLVLLSEQYALSRIEEEFKTEVGRDVTVSVEGDNRSYMLDGSLHLGNWTIGIQVKYVEKTIQLRQRIRSAVSQGMLFFDILKPVEPYKAKLIVAIVCISKELQAEIAMVAEKILREISTDMEIPTDYRIYNLEDIANPNN